MAGLLRVDGEELSNSRGEFATIRIAAVSISFHRTNGIPDRRRNLTRGLFCTLLFANPPKNRKGLVRIQSRAGIPFRHAANSSVCSKERDRWIMWIVQLALRRSYS